jgi:hypothetical protein
MFITPNTMLDWGDVSVCSIGFILCLSSKNLILHRACCPLTLALLRMSAKEPLIKSLVLREAGEARLGHKGFDQRFPKHVRKNNDPRTDRQG